MMISTMTKMMNGRTPENPPPLCRSATVFPDPLYSPRMALQIRSIPVARPASSLPARNRGLIWRSVISYAVFCLKKKMAEEGFVDLVDLHRDSAAGEPLRRLLCEVELRIEAG